MQASPFRANGPAPYAPKTTSLDFDPTPIDTDNLLLLLASPNASLAILAEDFQTTLPALTLWMMRPEIAERLDALESVFKRRARLFLANYSGPVMGVISRIISEYQEAESRFLFKPQDQKGWETSRRNRDTALRAVHYYLRLSRHFGENGPPSPRPPRLDRTDRPSHSNRPDRAVRSRAAAEAALADLSTDSAADPAPSTPDTPSGDAARVDPAEPAAAAITAQSTAAPHSAEAQPAPVSSECSQPSSPDDPHGATPTNIAAADPDAALLEAIENAMKVEANARSATEETSADTPSGAPRPAHPNAPRCHCRGRENAANHPDPADPLIPCICAAKSRTSAAPAPPSTG